MGATRHRYQPEFADLTNSVAVIDRDVVGIELALRPPARLEGIVRNARGEPVRDAAIHSGWPAGGDGPTVWTEATGRYVIEDLDPGPIEVRVVDVGLVKAILEPGKTTRVEHSVRWP